MVFSLCIHSTNQPSNYAISIPIQYVWAAIKAKQTKCKIQAYLMFWLLQSNLQRYLSVAVVFKQCNHFNVFLMLCHSISLRSKQRRKQTYSSYSVCTHNPSQQQAANHALQGGIRITMRGINIDNHRFPFIRKHDRVSGYVSCVCFCFCFSTLKGRQIKRNVW